MASVGGRNATADVIKDVGLLARQIGIDEVDDEF